MTITILTRYHGPTEAKGARVSASAEGLGRISRAFDHALNDRANHVALAQEFARNLSLEGQWFGVSTPQGYLFTRTQEPDFTI